MKEKILALIPARAGSTRVVKKNIRLLNNHPLMAYSIRLALSSGLFDDVVVSTDSEEFAQIGKKYGASVPFLRPEEYASTTSPDIEWISHALNNLSDDYDLFFILRPTSPFRKIETLKRALAQIDAKQDADSLRAVELVKEHPAKMWVVKGEYMESYCENKPGEHPLHSTQYQVLPKIYVQNSSLEIVKTETVKKFGNNAGNIVLPFLTNKAEGFAIDYEEDWQRAELMLSSGVVDVSELEIDKIS